MALAVFEAVMLGVTVVEAVVLLVPVLLMEARREAMDTPDSLGVVLAVLEEEGSAVAELLGVPVREPAGEAVEDTEAEVEEEGVLEPVPLGV